MEPAKQDASGRMLACFVQPVSLISLREVPHATYRCTTTQQILLIPCLLCILHAALH